MEELDVAFGESWVQPEQGEIQADDWTGKLVPGCPESRMAKQRFELHCDGKVQGRGVIKICFWEALSGFAAVQRTFYFLLRSVVLGVSSEDQQEGFACKPNSNQNVRSHLRPHPKPPKSPDHYSLDYTAYWGSECLPYRCCFFPILLLPSWAPRGRRAQSTGALGLRTAQVKRFWRAVVPVILSGLLTLCLSPMAFLSQGTCTSCWDTDMFQDISAHQVLKNGYYHILMVTSISQVSLPFWKFPKLPLGLIFCRRLFKRYLTFRHPFSS